MTTQILATVVMSFFEASNHTQLMGKIHHEAHMERNKLLKYQGMFSGSPSRCLFIGSDSQGMYLLYYLYQHRGQSSRLLYVALQIIDRGQYSSSDHPAQGRRSYLNGLSYGYYRCGVI